MRVWVSESEYAGICFVDGSFDSPTGRCGVCCVGTVFVCVVSRPLLDVLSLLLTPCLRVLARVVGLIA